jgi:hypothetical protein
MLQKRYQEIDTSNKKSNKSIISSTSEFEYSSINVELYSMMRIFYPRHNKTKDINAVQPPILFKLFLKQNTLQIELHQ